MWPEVGVMKARRRPSVELLILIPPRVSLILKTENALPALGAYAIQSIDIIEKHLPKNGILRGGVSSLVYTHPLQTVHAQTAICVMSLSLITHRTGGHGSREVFLTPKYV